MYKYLPIYTQIKYIHSEPGCRMYSIRIYYKLPPSLGRGGGEGLQNFAQGAFGSITEPTTK